MEVREASMTDLPGLMKLYTHLHNNPLPDINKELIALYNEILMDKHHHIILACEEDGIVSSCVLAIVLNLTHGQRPYAIIENVVTAEEVRQRGYASSVLAYAQRIARENNCYKIMLLTGSKQESTMSFYEKAGYNRNDKTGFILWL